MDTLKALGWMLTLTGMFANKDLSVSVSCINRNSPRCAQNVRGQKITGEKGHTEINASQTKYHRKNATVTK